MKTTFALSVLLAVAAARELSLAPRAHKRHNRFLGRREVPQEHSHEKFLVATRDALNLNNPDLIQDPVFALLGAAAAAEGQGNIADVECLQQATADQAFTNAKAAGDIDAMTAALVFRTLEKNTQAVGQKSLPCTSIQAVNPEIAALQQHQDPASDGAAALNKEITLELARQIASIGGDPLIALESGTFEPGQIGDPTGAGNTCDDLDDPIGCIFTKNLLVEDATPEEIEAAVAGIAVGDGEEVVEDGEEVVEDGEEVVEGGEEATTTIEAGITTTEVATTTEAATTTTAGEAVATDCPAAVTVTVTVTEAAATETGVVNRNGRGKNNGPGKNNGNNRNNGNRLGDILKIIRINNNRDH